MENQHDKLLTIKDVAARLGVSQASVYELVASGALPSLRVGPRRGVIRIQEREFEMYLDASRYLPTVAPKPVPRSVLKHIQLRKSEGPTR